MAILLGVLPVSGLTGNSSGAESSSSENSTKTIYVNSTKQPILFDSVGNFKEIIPKVKKTFTVQKLKMVTRLLYLPI